MDTNRSFERVGSTLSQYESYTLKALVAFIPQKEPRKYLYDLLTEYPRRPGKGLRPALCIATCCAFGGRMEEAINSAVAIELYHNAFLVHDDLEDGSEYRRGDYTMHVKYGLPIAVNVGDAMNVLTMDPLMRNLSILGPMKTLAVFQEMKHMVRESVEGQAMELGWVRDNVDDLTEADYLRMILKKTCWYTCITPCRVGALIGSKHPVNLEVFNRFGYYMGAAFQIQDDLLNLLSMRKRYGKEIGGDILEGKRTLILIHLLNSVNRKEFSEIVNLLGIPRFERTEHQVKWIYDLMEKYGCLDYAKRNARQLAGAAMKEFFNAYGYLSNSREKDFIFSLIQYMTGRDL